MPDAVDVEFIDQTPAPLAVRTDEPIRALVSPDEARRQWDAYQRLKAAIADPDDYQEFYDKKTRRMKRFAKKSFVKKIQAYFGLTVSVVASQHYDLGDGDFAFTVTARATAVNGRSVEAAAACATTEERFSYGDSKKRAFHDVLSTAETRATNRAVMNLIGGGEVTAEEVRGAPAVALPVEPQAAPLSDAPAPGSDPREGSEGAATAQESFDRARCIRGIFATINEFALISDDGVKLQHDTDRHNILERLYAKRSLQDLTDGQLIDFRRRVRGQYQKAKEASA